MALNWLTPTAQGESQGAKTYTEEGGTGAASERERPRVNQALAKQKKQYEKQLSLSALDTEARVQAEKDLRIQELEEQLRCSLDHDTGMEYACTGT